MNCFAGCGSFRKKYGRNTGNISVSGKKKRQLPTLFRLAAGLESTDPRRGSDHYPGKGCPGSCEGKLCGRQCAGGSFPHGSDSGKAGENGGGPYRSQPFRDPSGTGYSERDRDFLSRDRKCMVIGNGAMGKLTASTLLVRGGGCDRYRASVPEWYCGHSLRLPQDRLQRAHGVFPGLRSGGQCHSKP